MYFIDSMRSNQPVQLLQVSLELKLRSRIDEIKLDVDIAQLLGVDRGGRIHH